MSKTKLTSTNELKSIKVNIFREHLNIDIEIYNDLPSLNLRTVEKWSHKEYLDWMLSSTSLKNSKLYLRTNQYLLYDNDTGFKCLLSKQETLQLIAQVLSVFRDDNLTTTDFVFSVYLMLVNHTSRRRD